MHLSGLFPPPTAQKRKTQAADLLKCVMRLAAWGAECAVHNRKRCDLSVRAKSMRYICRGGIKMTAIIVIGR
jgi:hypothetical protein